MKMKFWEKKNFKKKKIICSQIGARISDIDTLAIVQKAMASPDAPLDSSPLGEDTALPNLLLKVNTLIP